MSDDKKRDRALQRRVHERQAKTGESYQDAWRKLTESGEPLIVPKIESDAQHLLDAWELIKSTEIGWPPSTDEPPIIPRIESDAQSHARLVLPLHLPLVLPNQQTRAVARAKKALDIKAIYISGTGTPGGSADWIVNDIEIDGRAQLTRKDLPGDLFSGRGLAAAKRAITKLSLEGFDPVERDRALVLVVTYVGPNSEGSPFYATAMGSKPQQRFTIIPIASKSPLSPTAKTTITARVQSASFQMARLEIGNEGALGSGADWIIEDLRINGRSQFAQAGPIPGDMFSMTSIDSFIKPEPCAAGNAIEIDVIYIGVNESGAIFTALLEGTVMRDDYSTPPPDLHVVVETAGQGPGDIVIATCNWRAPATDNCTN
jgi:hypothetical protein